VAVNLAGTAKDDLERGDVLTLVGQWRPTSVIDVILRPVRGLDHGLTGRGAYKLHVGSAERDARLRLYDRPELRRGEEAFARITLGRPVVVDIGDSFVLREAGRRQTVAGGEVLDTEPPGRGAPKASERLRPRVGANRPELAHLLVQDRGAVRASDVHVLTGARPDDAVDRGDLLLGGWLVTGELVDRSAAAVTDALGRYHAAHPLRPGLELPDARALLATVHPTLGDPGLSDAVLGHLTSAGLLARDAATVRLPTHRASTAGREDADRLVTAVASAEPTPPSVRELISGGFGQELIRAAAGEGRLVRISQDIVVTPEFLARAEAVVRQLGRPPGLTVSGFREALGTSRKYALPLLEYFDARGVTLRRGDLRVLRG
jgi:selenocysteine-specific elongation factor